MIASPFPSVWHTLAGRDLNHNDDDNFDDYNDFEEDIDGEDD